MDNPAPRRWIKRILLALAVCTPIYVISWFHYQGGLSEFSPQTLEYRTRIELLMPMLGIPIYRGPWSYSKDELTEFLIAKGYWTADETIVQEWMLAGNWNMQWEDGFARFYIVLGERGSDWIEWSKNNPKLAAYIWPKVLTALRSGDIRKINEMLEKLRWVHSAKTIEDYEWLISNIKFH